MYGGWTRPPDLRTNLVKLTVMLSSTTQAYTQYKLSLYLKSLVIQRLLSTLLWGSTPITVFTWTESFNYKRKHYQQCFSIFSTTCNNSAKQIFKHFKNTPSITAQMHLSCNRVVFGVLGYWKPDIYEKITQQQNMIELHQFTQNQLHILMISISHIIKITQN